MNKKQWRSMLLLAMLAGFVGGMVVSWLFANQPVFAEKRFEPAKVIEAQEFRLMDRDGKTVARLTVRDGRVLAEIPELTKWAIKLSEEAKGKE